MRTIEEGKIEIVVQLLKKITDGIESMMKDYTKLYSKEELVLLKTIYEQINTQLVKIQSDSYNKEKIKTLLEYENILKPFIFRCWNLEVEEGAKYTSWLKEDKLKSMPKVISATFSKDVEDSFCDTRYGINYEVLIDGFLGACNKDAATIIQDRSKESLYTIGLTDDNRVINTYNLATPIITPAQVFDKGTNTYKSKHNEIILDSRYIRPIGIIYMDDNDLEMVEKISSIYSIPIILEKKEKRKK